MYSIQWEVAVDHRDLPGIARCSRYGVSGLTDMPSGTAYQVPPPRSQSHDLHHPGPMSIRSPLRLASLALLVGGLACAKNNANPQVGAARDTTGTSASDSAKANQTKSGVTNTKTGESTLGPGATRTRPDQGQPVTSKGDTVNTGVDSTNTQR